MQTATGNLINDRSWEAESIPGYSTQRWTGYIDIRETDAPGKWYSVSLPDTGRNDAANEPDKIMVLMNGFKIIHFGVSPYDAALANASVQLSLRNPGFTDNEKSVSFGASALTPREKDLLLRKTEDFGILPNAPYLSHEVWVRLTGAPKYNGRLIVSIGAVRTGKVFDFFIPGNREPGAPIWGGRRNGSIGIIPGSEGRGDDGIDPRRRDQPEDSPFSVSPGSIEVAPGETVTLYATKPGIWSIAGGGTLSAATGETVTFTAGPSVGTGAITIVNSEDPTQTVVIPFNVTVPSVFTVEIRNWLSLMQVGDSRNLTAVVTGLGSFDPNVTWTITGPGVLSGFGNSRTLTVTGPGSITVRATSVGDPSKYDTVTTTATAPVPGVTSISLVSDRYSMTTAQTANLLANVIPFNGGATTVTYSITGPGTLAGALNSRILTPTGAGTVTVTATSTQDPSKSASVDIAVTTAIVVAAVTLTGAPSTNSPLGTTNLLATVNGTGAYDSAVTWAVVSGPGQFTPGTFTAPSTTGTLVFGPTPTTGATTIRATSVADPSKFAEFTVTLGPDALIASVVVTPSATTVAPGGTFTATATVNPASRSQAVIWSVNGPATIVVSSSGTPTVTTTGPGVVTVIATSVANPGVSGSAIVNSVVTSVVNTVTAFRSTSTGAALSAPPPIPGGTSGFVNAAVTGVGAITTTVTWTIISGGGTITPTTGNIANYTAPAITSTGQFAVVRATSTQDSTKFADVAISFDATIAVNQVIWVPDGPLTSTWYDDDAAPVSATVNVLGTGAYNSDVTFTAPIGVTVTPGLKTGTITPVAISFASTLPKTPQTYTIRATSIADPTKFDDLVIGRVFELRPILLMTNYEDAWNNPYPLTPSQPVPPQTEVGYFWNVTAFLSGPYLATTPPVSWSVVGPATFTEVTTATIPSPSFSRIRLQMIGSGTVTVTATSIYDPSKTSTKTFTVAARPVVSSVNIFRPDGLPPTTAIAKGTLANPEETAVVFSADVVGQNLTGPSASTSVQWTIVSGPGTLVDPSFSTLPSPANDPGKSILYVPPSGGASSGAGPVTLKATSYQDPSKSALVTFNLLPQNILASISIFDSSLVDNSAVQWFESGPSKKTFDIRRTYELTSQAGGSGSLAGSGATLSIVSGGSIAALAPIASPGTGTNPRKYYLTRTPGQSGWVKVRATSVGDPTKYKEAAYYFAPDVFGVMAITHNHLDGSRANVIRICWPGLSEPVTFSGQNCVADSSISAAGIVNRLEPVSTLPELDSQGRGYAFNIIPGPTGPYSVTLAPASNPSAALTVSFSVVNGFIVGQMQNPDASGYNRFKHYDSLGFLNQGGQPTLPRDYSIAPAQPAPPALNSTI